jgi:hypothetical protein
MTLFYPCRFQIPMGHSSSRQKESALLRRQKSNAADRLEPPPHSEIRSLGTFAELERCVVLAYRRDRLPYRHFKQPDAFLGLLCSVCLG